MDGLTLAGTLRLERGPDFALFYFGEKCEKPLHQAHPRLQKYQLECAKKSMISDLAKILKASTGNVNNLLHNPLRNTFLRGKQRCGTLSRGKP